MSSPKYIYSTIFPLFAILITLAGCSTQGDDRVLPIGDADPVDLSGSWEMDYSQSDNIQAELDSMVRELQRRSARSSPQGSNQPGIVVGGGGSNSGSSIIGLARMADLITQAQLLEVKQSKTDIEVKREGTFALSCEFHDGQFHSVETPLGTELCGWDSHQLVFRILLPEGLKIQHRMTLGPDGERLNIATTVVSDQVSYPFTLDRVYNRFVPGSNGYTCRQTLSKGRVCTTESR